MVKVLPQFDLSSFFFFKSALDQIGPKTILIHLCTFEICVQWQGPFVMNNIFFFISFSTKSHTTEENMQGRNKDNSIKRRGQV